MSRMVTVLTFKISPQDNSICAALRVQPNSKGKAISHYILYIKQYFGYNGETLLAVSFPPPFFLLHKSEGLLTDFDGIYLLGWVFSLTPT